MFQIYHYRNRTRRWDIQLYETDGTTEVLLAAQDVAIIQVYKIGDLPVLEIRSDEIEAGGSKLTFESGTNNVTLLVGQGDSNIGDIETGNYEMDIIVVDASDTLEGTDADADGIAAAKHVETGCVFIHPSGTGTIDEDESSSG